MPDAQQGHQFRGGYYHEDNGFASAPNDTDLKPFGGNALFDRAEGSNQAVQMFEPGSRQAVDIIERMFDGAWGVSFVYTNPWFFDFIYGSPSTTDNGDGSYTHQYSGDTPRSQQLVIGRESSGKERVLEGCVATNISLTPSVNGLVNVSMSGAYADETIKDPPSIIDQPTLNHDAMTFADASLDFAGSTIGYIQDGSLSIANNTELIGEWGNRTPIDMAPRTLIPTVDFSKINEAGETDNLSQMYGSTNATTVQASVDTADAMTFSLDNGSAAGSGINQMDANLVGAFPDTYAENGLGDPEADVTEDINRIAETVSIDATNEVSTAR